MTDFEHDPDFEPDPAFEPTHGLALLVDPLTADPIRAQAELPSLTETTALFDRMVGANEQQATTETHRRRALRLLAVAAALALVLVAASFIRPDRGMQPAAAVTAAIEQTDAVSSGSFTVIREMTANGRTLTQTGHVSFDGADYSIRYENVGGIIDPADGVTPPSIEFREVDGVPYVGTDRGWTESIDSPATHPMRLLSTRVATAAATADDLDSCENQTAGTNSYCLTTEDPLLVAALQPGMSYSFETVRATIQVDIDDSTGRLTRIVVDAADAVVSQPTDAPGPGLNIPLIEAFHAESSFGGLDQPVNIEIPDLTLQPPDGTVPWQCDGLQHSQDIVECLRYWGEPELADYYSTLDLEPSTPPLPGVYGPTDAPLKGADD